MEYFWVEIVVPSSDESNGCFAAAAAFACFDEKLSIILCRGGGTTLHYEH
jgi:hypothetical protein